MTLSQLIEGDEIRAELSAKLRRWEEKETAQAEQAGPVQDDVHADEN